MAVALIDALVMLARPTSSTMPGWLRTLLRVTVCTCTGWTSIAVFVNFAAALADQGVSINGNSGFVWQLLVVVAATIAAIALVRASKSNLSSVIAAE